MPFLDRPLTRLAPAKLNLGLHVLRRRPDGYHDLSTVFLPIGWADRLEAQPSSSLALTCSDPTLPTGEGNLVIQAARALAAEASTLPHGDLHLQKHVPYGAGLGSGSSDAAATLRVLQELWKTDASEVALHGIAATLGSDVPFFLDGRPALGTGRGEVLTPLKGADGSGYRCPFALVVAVPPVHVSTAEAYSRVVPSSHGRPDLAAAVVSNDLARWRQEISNDFQSPIEALHPEVAKAREALEAAGAGYAAMSGSGSAVFGVFEQESEAASAAEAMQESGCRVWAGPADVNGSA